MRLDSLDEQIIAALQDDGRASYSQVGARVGLSAPAVKRRVDRLRREGAIRGFAAIVDPGALGWTTEAYVEIWCSPRGDPARLFAAVTDYPQVVEACTVSGDADALLRVRATSVADFERVLERIGAVPIVVRTRSSIVLSRGPSRS